MSTKHPQRLLKVPQVAERLAVSERTVWRLIDSKALKPVSIGGATRIRESDVERLIDGDEGDEGDPDAPDDHQDSDPRKK